MIGDGDAGAVRFIVDLAVLLAGLLALAAVCVAADRLVRWLRDCQARRRGGPR